MGDAPDPADERVGKTLSGKWKLDSLLGVGGMAAVYAASHRNGATAAIKILHPEFARRAESRTRFLREAYIANKAGKGAVAVLDDDVADDGSPYLVMELLRGEPVDLRAERLGGKLLIADVLWVASQTLATLETAHEAGIIHRDLKPENLFWTTDNRLKVLDFGIARLRDASALETTRTGMILGTPSFMAPEQAIGSTPDIDARADIWSVGAIMFSLLTGRDVHLAEGGNAVVIAATKHAPSLASVDGSLPRAVGRIVDRALAFQKDARYRSARAMREEVDRVREGKGDVEVLSIRIPDSRPLGVETPPPSSRSSSSRRGFATQMSAVDTAALRDLFGLVEKALTAHLEHGAAHPQSIRTLDMAYRGTASTLMEAHIGLFWNVEADGFIAGKKERIWQPRPPLPPTPGRMYKGGVRMLGLLPGLTKQEFEIVTRLLACDLAPFNDFATLLQASALEHVVYRIDAPVTAATPGLESLDPSSSGAVPVAALLGMLAATEDPAIRATLFSRLERRGDGHEPDIAKVLQGASIELAMGLLRVLSVVDTAPAREAVRAGTRSPHALVRIDAFAKLEPGGERLRAELRMALEDARPEVRIGTLVGIEKYKIKAAGPALALRVRASAFDALPLDEKRMALGTLGALMPSRAEAIAIELLQDQRLISPEAHEATRELAADLLGRVGASREAREGLETASKSRWRNSARVRTASTNALAALDARAAADPSSRRSSMRASKPSLSKPPPTPRKRSSKRPTSISKSQPAPGKRPSSRPPGKRRGTRG